MTIRYVGPGGNNSNDGLSWATRKLTLNGVEDTPVAPGDIVYVGPGVYREQLTCDVSGTTGNPISYVGDYSGADTDGVGGPILISGSNNDYSAARAYGIYASAKNYRTFDNFAIGLVSSACIAAANSNNWTIRRCIVSQVSNAAYPGMTFEGTSQNNILVERCVFFAAGGLRFTASSFVNNAAHTVQNCLFFGGVGGEYSQPNNINIWRVGGITVRNCTFTGCWEGVRIVADINTGQTVTVNNCIFQNLEHGLRAITTGKIIENYNSFYCCSYARTNAATGLNSINYAPNWDMRFFFEMLNGGRVVSIFDLASISKLIENVNAAGPDADLRGVAKIGAQREKGCLEYDVSVELGHSSSVVVIED